MSRTRFLAATLCVMSLTYANSQLRQAGPKLVGTGATGTAGQGQSVAISGDGNTAIVGGQGDDSGVGAAWIFTRSGGIWTQQGSKLVGAGAVGVALQGAAVSISADGNTAIVGGGGDNNHVGATWIFTRSGDVWSQQGGKLIGTGATGVASQGNAVSVSSDGNTVIVGGPDDNAGVGAAWIFTRSGTVWIQQGPKLVGTGAVGASIQGGTVSLSSDGNTAIVGGPYDNSNAGAAWVFTRTGGVWTQQGSKLIGTGAVGAAYQGISVSISSDGNTTIVGGVGDNSLVGAAWVFTRSGSVWSQQGGKLVGTGGWGATVQGIVSISSNGNLAIVGGAGDNNYAGAIWIFARSGGVWTQQGPKIIGTGGLGASYQGVSVSVSSDGGTAFVGGYADNAYVGAAWVYTNAQPVISSVDDVRSDQGGTVAVNWDKSILDMPATSWVTSYWVWRGIQPSVLSPGAIILNRGDYLSALSKHAVTALTFMQNGDSPLAIYWQYITSLPSHGFDHYSYACPTLADSTWQGTPWRYFIITATTSDPNIYWDSAPDSGYSVDNLAPSAPGGALLTPLANALRLQWNVDRSDPDVGHYTVYRSTTSGFPLADSTRFRTTTDSTVVDSSTIAGLTYYYRITTADVHGNESLPTQELGDSPLPIQLASFTAQLSPSGNGVLLEWSTVSEVNNFGFEVQRSLENENNYQTLQNSFVAGHGTSNELHLYTFIDSTGYPAHWFYRLRQIDLGGMVHFSNGVSINTSTDVPGQETPRQFILSQNYPDPFNPSTTIRYQLPHAAHVTVKVYDILGREIATLIDEMQDAGYKSTIWRGGNVATGIYFYRILATSPTGESLFTETRKCMVLK